MPRQFMFLYGKNSVLARLQNGPDTVQRVYIDEEHADRSIIDAAGENRIPVEHVSRKSLLRLKRADGLQGVIAQVHPFSYSSFDTLLYEHPDQERFSFLFLDRIFDPHNLGAVIRTAACFGSFAVVIPRHKACAVTEAVLHVASGGENFVSVAMVSNLSNALRKAKQAGYWIAGTVIENGQDISVYELPFPLCVVLGSEGEGVRYGVGKEVDLHLSIPMYGVSLSFNVSNACAILCYEITRQRTGKGAAHDKKRR